MFSKILIANRGEIAVRIIRACKEMGIATVAVYSEADSEALHVALADESVCIGRAAAKDSYLQKRNIISAALTTRAQAIHPGYGFLSENAEFAALCKAHGLVFIGPESKVISAMGDKNNARRLMKKIGVPTVPGTDCLTSPADALREAKNIGYPLLVKASAGGGGKGIRLVESEEQLEAAFYAASEEALLAFGNGDVYLEKYLSGIRHIEIQVLGDNAGNIVSLGERDCSLQSNKQKEIEETPCPVLSERTQKAMSYAAVRAARAAGYTNAGTVEFLLDNDEKFYFIEMNTRLQVEHPITEQRSCVDLVKWQIRIASQKLLDFSQRDIALRGHSIECRINAKSGGVISFLHIPGGLGVRFDTALVAGTKVAPFYDSMIGKLIVSANSREAAIRKMEVALCELLIQGIDTNIEDQLKIIRDTEFQRGLYDTDFLQRRGL